MRNLRGPRVMLAGVIVFAIGFVIGVAETEGDGFWNKVSAVLGPLGALTLVAGIVLTVRQRRHA